MAKTIRKEPTSDKPKRKYKRDRNAVRTVLRSTMDTDFTPDLQPYQVLAQQLAMENHELGQLDL